MNKNYCGNAYPMVPLMGTLEMSHPLLGVNGPIVQPAMMYQAPIVFGNQYQQPLLLP
jgi:hypothetical protein